MKINNILRLAASWRRFKFLVFKTIGFFWLIERIPCIQIKEPYNKLYQREKKNGSKKNSKADQ